MPRASPCRSLRLCLLALLLALPAVAPSAQAWVCYPDPQRVCERVQEATGLILEIARSPEGVGVVVTYGAAGYQDHVIVTVCVHNLRVWISSTGHCTTPPTSPRERVHYMLP